MKTMKTNQKITCENLQDARLKADTITNGIIITKDNTYLIVNYKTFESLKFLGYNQVR